FNAFQAAPGLYPSHITALLPSDLQRICQECGLTQIELHFTGEGRMPFTPRRWPRWLGLRGCLFSDNVMITGRKPMG
ncbi:hypothetical protein ACXYUI_32480, partial [Klebsiella pneumoniae]